jgi:carboxylesterase
MNYNDFYYMRRGKQISVLTQKDAHLLQPIDKRGSDTKRALLLLHGFSSSPAVFRYLIPQISAYDALICPVLPGHGDSVAAFSSCTAQDWLLAVHRICEGLLNEFEQVDVLGFSLGGLIACELSQHFPLNHLFLLAPALKLKINLKLMLKLAHTLNYLGVYQIRNAAGNLLSNDSAEIAYRALPITTIIEVLQLIQNHQWTAPKCSIDLFLGMQDGVVSSTKVVQLFHSHPNTRIHWLRNSAHVLPLDNDHQEIAQRMNQILD